MLQAFVWLAVVTPRAGGPKPLPFGGGEADRAAAMSPCFPCTEQPDGRLTVSRPLAEGLTRCDVKGEGCAEWRDGGTLLAVRVVTVRRY